MFHATRVMSTAEATGTNYVKLARFCVAEMVK